MLLQGVDGGPGCGGLQPALVVFLLCCGAVAVASGSSADNDAHASGVGAVSGGAVGGAERCTGGHDVSPARRRLAYSGPSQRIARDRNERFRCFTGQHYEDLFLFQHFLHNVSGGFFIELGALDAYSYSVTYFFEQFLDWRGLLIEASPRNLELHVRRSARVRPRRRRRSPFVLAAVCNNSSAALTYVSKSGTGAGILDFMPPTEQQRNLAECERHPRFADLAAGAVLPHDEILAFRPRSGCALVPLRCMHLGDELRRRGVSHVDLFVLDVEGAELEVLQTLRLHETPVRYFVVELDGRNQAKDARARCILRQAGMEPLGRLDLNEIWHLPNFDPARFAAEYSPPTPRGRWEGCFASPMRFAGDNVLVNGEGPHAAGAASPGAPFVDPGDPRLSDIASDAARLDSDFRDDVLDEHAADGRGSDVGESLLAGAPLLVVGAAVAVGGVFAVMRRHQRRKRLQQVPSCA